MASDKTEPPKTPLLAGILSFILTFQSAVAWDKQVTSSNRLLCNFCLGNRILSLFPWSQSRLFCNILAGAGSFFNKAKSCIAITYTTKSNSHSIHIRRNQHVFLNKKSEPFHQKFPYVRNLCLTVYPCSHMSPPTNPILPKHLAWERLTLGI